MNLAILMANTDVSAFSDKYPKDGEKFSDFVACVRPLWSCSVYDATQSILPADLTAYDGFIITGSPASVHDKDAWVAELSDLVVEIHKHKLPIFGACYGHQIIAKALGGTVGRNSRGFVLGVAQSETVSDQPWMTGLPKHFPLYAAHGEQVLRLPETAQAVLKTENCPNAGFVIGKTIYTTQYHPEMTPHFIRALTEHLATSMSRDVIQNAHDTLSTIVDMPIFAESVARFFETSIQE